MSSPPATSSRIVPRGRAKLPGPKKGVQRRQETAIRAPTPVFVPRNAIADARTPRPTKPTAKCANPTCTKPEIIDDDGTKVCINCGTVSQESNIVSEVTFGENAAGAAVVQGTFVGADQRHGRGGLGPRGFHGGDDSPNRAQTLALARTTIAGLVSKLGLPTNIIDQAAHIFQICQAQMVQGRSIRSVAAVSLYTACRRPQAFNANHIMLIDIAEHMNLNVFSLGSIFTKMVRRCPNIGPTEVVNPENLILRFARALEFGRDTNKIVNEATRIVQRMKRDWMVTGRRPSGICGAALIIAARMNNFRRTVREMVYVVKVTEITINKRLEEFKITDASKFTVDEFRVVNLDALKEHDPPAFYLAQQGPKAKRKRGRPRKNPLPETAAEIEDGEEPSEGGEDEEEDPRPTQRRRIDKDGFAIPDIPIDPALSLTTATQNEEPIDEALTSAVNSAISEMERDETLQAAQRDAASKEHDVSAASRDQDANDDTASVVTTDSAMTDSTTMSETTGLPRKTRRGRPKGSKNKGPMPVGEAEAALEAAIENEVRTGLEEIEHDPDLVTSSSSSSIKKPQSLSSSTAQLLPTPPATQPGTQQSRDSPTSQLQAVSQVPSTRTPNTTSVAPIQTSSTSSSSQPIVSSSATSTKQFPKDIPMTPEISPDEFDSDPEVANCLLSPAEREIKERLWVHENNTWLREQHRKKIQAQLKNADPANQNAQANRAGKHRRRRPRLGDPTYLKNRGPGNKDGSDKDNNTNADGPEGEEGGDEQQQQQQENNDAASSSSPRDPSTLVTSSMSKSERAAGLAVKSMMENRGLSTRINYNVMSTLFPGLEMEGTKMDSARSIDEKERSKRRRREERGGSVSSSTSRSRPDDMGNVEEGVVTTTMTTTTAEQSQAPSPSPSPSLSQSQPQSQETQPRHLTEPAAEEPAATEEVAEEEEEEAEESDELEEEDLDKIMGADDDGDDDDEEDEDVEDAFAGRYRSSRPGGYDEDEDEDEDEE